MKIIYTLIISSLISGMATCLPRFTADEAELFLTESQTLVIQTAQSFSPEERAQISSPLTEKYGPIAILLASACAAYMNRAELYEHYKKPRYTLSNGSNLLAQIVGTPSLIALSTLDILEQMRFLWTKLHAFYRFVATMRAQATPKYKELYHKLLLRQFLDPFFNSFKTAITQCVIAECKKNLLFNTSTIDNLSPNETQAFLRETYTIAVQTAETLPIKKPTEFSPLLNYAGVLALKGLGLYQCINAIKTSKNSKLWAAAEGLWGLKSGQMGPRMLIKLCNPYNWLPKSSRFIIYKHFNLVVEASASNNYKTLMNNDAFKNKALDLVTQYIELKTLSTNALHTFAHLFLLRN